MEPDQDDSVPAAAAMAAKAQRVESVAVAVQAVVARAGAPAVATTEHSDQTDTIPLQQAGLLAALDPLSIVASPVGKPHTPRRDHNRDRDRTDRSGPSHWACCFAHNGTGWDLPRRNRLDPDWSSGRALDRTTASATSRPRPNHGTATASSGPAES